MMRASLPSSQRGAITLFLSLLMLLLITVLVTTAFTMSTTGLRSVGNMQVRNEALAAAQVVMERELGGPFYTTPTRLDDQSVDINNDGTNDYLVDLGSPACVRAARASTAAVSSVTLPGLTTTSAWITTWEFEAVVSDPVSGAQVSVVQAVRAVLSDSQKNVSCPG